MKTKLCCTVDNQVAQRAHEYIGLGKPYHNLSHFVEESMNNLLVVRHEDFPEPVDVPDDDADVLG